MKKLLAALAALTVLAIPTAASANVGTYSFDTFQASVLGGPETLICYVEVDPGTVSVVGVAPVDGNLWTKDLGYAYQGRNYQVWSVYVPDTAEGAYPLTFTYSAPLDGQAVEEGCTSIPGDLVENWTGVQTWTGTAISFPTPNSATQIYFGYGKTTGEASVVPNTPGDHAAVTPEGNIVITRCGHARPADQGTSYGSGISVAVGFRVQLLAHPDQPEG